MASKRSNIFAVLARVEALERFGYCGTQLLLVLYIASGRATVDAAGLGTVERWLGVAADDPAGLAARMFGVFAAATCLAPLLGVPVAARLGRRNTVAIGCVLMTVGHAVMAAERWLLIGLVLLVAGAGCTIANRLALLGDAYENDTSARARGFALYTAATNVGVVAAPLVCGTLGERWGWSWGFAAAALGMGIGTLMLLAGWRILPSRDALRPVAPSSARAPATDGGRRALIAVVPLLVPFVLVIAIVNLAYALVPIWATSALDRQIGDWMMPVSWLIAFDGMASIVAIAATTALWRHLAQRGREPGDIAKIAIGCAIVACAYAILAVIARLDRAPLVGALAFYLVLDASAAWIEPPLAALIARLSPLGESGLPLAAMKAVTALAALLLAALGGLYRPLGPPTFWMLAAMIAAVAAALVMAIRLVGVPATRSPAKPRLHRD